ncbi:MAG: hypothetical protein AAF512_19160, partial [Pseudomonadota bacterium]
MNLQTYILSAAMVIFLVSNIAFASDVSSDGNPFIIRDYQHYNGPADPNLSPDKSKIAYVLYKPDYENNVWTNRLVLLDRGKGSRDFITETKQYAIHPRWSPSGDRIAFIANTDSKSRQIFEYVVESKQTIQATEHSTSISHFRWSPGGGGYAYIASTKVPQKTNPHLRSYVVEGIGYPGKPPALSDIWVSRRNETATPKRVAVNIDARARVDWHPDGQALVYARNDKKHFDSFFHSVMYLDLEQSQETRIAQGSYPQFSPDGRSILFLAREGEYTSGPRKTFVYDLETKTIRQFATNLDREALGNWYSNTEALLY